MDIALKIKQRVEDFIKLVTEHNITFKIVKVNTTNGYVYLPYTKCPVDIDMEIYKLNSTFLRYFDTLPRNVRAKILKHFMTIQEFVVYDANDGDIQAFVNIVMRNPVSRDVLS